jgi:hypothetical protein
MFNELPCLCVYYKTESTEVAAGDRYLASEYERKLDITIDVVAEQPYSVTGLESLEDDLDKLGRQVEQAIKSDELFSRLLTGYTGSLRDESLLVGSRLLSVTPYDVEAKAEVTRGCQSIDFELVYNDEGFVERRKNAFESYLIKINKVGWDESTVDPTLIEGQGDL